MVKRILITILGPLLMLGLFCPLISATSEMSRSEVIEYSRQCLDCHEGYDTTLTGTPHQFPSEGEMKATVVAGCIGCHSGWANHINDPSADNIETPAEMKMGDQALLCSQCHSTPHQATMQTTDPHAMAGVDCVSCHSIHNSASVGVPFSSGLCAGCHTDVMAEFKRRSVHPLMEGSIQCVDCHSFDVAKDPTHVVGLDWSCQSCHPDKTGPFLHEHPPSYTYSIDGVGCLECHQPHGSQNDRLLNQPLSGVCLQCHAVPPLHRTKHSGLGMKLACTECHSEIHGSFDNALLLDPNINVNLASDCYQSGCHSTND